MSKHLTKDQWMMVIKLYNDGDDNSAIVEYCKGNTRPKISPYGVSRLKSRIKKRAKLVDNNGMKALERKPRSARPNKLSIKQRPVDNSDIPAIIDRMTDKEKEYVIKDGIIQKRQNKPSQKTSEARKQRCLSKTLIVEMYKIHRTSLYTKPTRRMYRWDYLKPIVGNIGVKSKFIYGSRKLAVQLYKFGIFISDRTLRDYMKRGGFIVETRRKYQKREAKNTTVSYPDLVKRNFNPLEDNIIATDVTYIPANETEHHVYLSVMISHKTKLIEGGSMSKSNDAQLVVDTFKQLNRDNLIIHSDHGRQYSSAAVIAKKKDKHGRTSMSRVGNSLDNREVEYFFSCLKGEFLKKHETRNMKFNDIFKLIKTYMDGYNNCRIQKRLQGLSPLEWIRCNQECRI